MKKLSEIIASVENSFSARSKRKIAHKQNELDFKTRKDFINSKEFMNENTESDKVTETVTKKVNAKTANTQRMTQEKVLEIHENRIGMIQLPNGNWQAKTGDIDGKFTTWARLTKWLVVSKDPKNNAQNRIFFNHAKPNGLFISQALKAGFEVSFN
jgi:hypothetical protein